MMRVPDKAVLAETNQSVAVEEVAIGTDLLVTAGERIPLDGLVVKGEAAVDESSLTGEATPLRKVVGSNVFSGTIIQSGFLKVLPSTSTFLFITFIPHLTFRGVVFKCFFSQLVQV